MTTGISPAQIEESGMLSESPSAVPFKDSPGSFTSYDHFLPDMSTLSLSPFQPSFPPIMHVIEQSSTRRVQFVGDESVGTLNVICVPSSDSNI
jgi:hypothetical protein